MRIGNLSGRLTLFTGDVGIDVEAASGGLFRADPQDVYRRWAEFTQWAPTVDASEAVPFSFQDLGAPAPRPYQVFAIGANYRDHVEEAGLPIPDAPMIFTKWPSSFTGPTGEIVLPGPTVDWEVELVVVMGQLARNVPAEEAWSYVAGVTIGQDLSDRTLQMRGNVHPQMSLGKSLPGFSPTGPWLITPDEFADPDDIEISCAVNGETMQNARTSGMVFPVPALIADLSAHLPLEPGDVIFTGTAGGVGAVRTPPRFLTAGDELITTIKGIGEMRHRFVSA